MQDHAAISVGGGVDVFARAQAGDDEGHLVFDAHRHVLLQPVIAFVDDLVDGKGRGRRLGVGAVVGGQGFSDLGQPTVELRCRARIERGHGAHHPGFALGDDELRRADDEQRRGDDRQGQVAQYSRQHGQKMAVRAGAAAA